jgi:hypothetical protein
MAVPGLKSVRPAGTCMSHDEQISNLSNGNLGFKE